MATALDDIFTNDGWRAVDGETPDERIGQAMHLLSNVVGAKWQTHFRMTTGGSATQYVLLHLTNHDAGRDLMKECRCCIRLPSAWRSNGSDRRSR